MDSSTYRAKELTDLIQTDISELQERPELKKFFHNIKQVSAIGSDDVAQVWAHFVRSNLKPQNSGSYKLELFYISQNDNGLKAIVQYHFIDLNTGDSVEEFARYYDLKVFYD